MSSHDWELSKEVMRLAERTARLYVERRSAPGSVPESFQPEALPADEGSILDAAGLDISEAVQRGEADPATEAHEQYLNILSTSMTVKETSVMLGVSPRRVRQMIRERSLATILDNRRYLVPQFQFVDHKLVPEFSSIYSVTPPDVPLILFFRWFTQPSSDLETPEEDESCDLSPRDWLMKGFDPSPIQRMAKLL